MLDRDGHSTRARSSRSDENFTATKSAEILLMLIDDRQILIGYERLIRTVRYLEIIKFIQRS